MSFTDRTLQQTATIASSGTTSNEVDLMGTTLVGLMLPATMTSTGMKFHASMTSGGTYQVIQDGAGNDVSKTISGGKYIGLDPALFRGVRFLKLVAGSSEGADRSITVIGAAL